jgi:hypothetical protein
MKISFPNSGSDAGISVRAVINALLTRHKTERGHTAYGKENVPRITSGWDYRPRKTNPRCAVGRPEAETVEVLSQGPSERNENDITWFNSLECATHTLIGPDPTAKDARTSALLSDHEYAVQFRRTTKVL